MDFQDNASYMRTLEANRNGSFTRSQRLIVTVAALVTSVGLVFMCAVLIAIAGAAASGMAFQGLAGAVFFAFFLMTYLYLATTLFVNARAFVPEALSGKPVRVVEGELNIQLPQRHREELPFSYVVGEYSFAPFLVPYEVKMEKGRRYRVYYATHSRMFLSIEPVA